MSKHGIRTELLKCREALSAKAILDKSALIQNALLLLPEFVAARTVALYSPVRSEVRTEQVFAAGQQAGKQILYPRTCGMTLEFVPVADPAVMAVRRYGIREPDGGCVFPLAEIDLVILPGVAYDRSGVRLGYGKGCYDRLFADDDTRPVLLGIGYDFQLVEKLPVESHDVLLDMVLTEKRLVRCLRTAPAAP